jgi:very-short-patch-repair endonuclease
MDPKTAQSNVWRLAHDQHGVVTRAQLLDLGFGTDAIRHRIERGRLHCVSQGVYALGRPELTRHGRWMAAVSGCGPGAALSHDSAAALLALRDKERGRIEVSVPVPRAPRRPGITVHRRTAFEVTRHQGIPVTTVACTLVDLAGRLRTNELVAAVNEADKLRLADPESLRAALHAFGTRPGVAILRRLIDRRTFVLTDSELERRFLPLARRAGLSPPETGRTVNGYRVDFYWPDLGLVVETDGLRYHRMPAAQTQDRRRDQAHTAAGLTVLRFRHAQVAHEPEHVCATLAAVAGRLRDTPP